MPPNLRFQAHSLTKPFPFEFQKFDILHSRFVFRHVCFCVYPFFFGAGFLDLRSSLGLRKFSTVRCSSSNPEGGCFWKMLKFKEDAGLLHGQEAFKQFQQHRTAKGVNPRTASALQGIIESSRLFSEVNVRKIVLPISKCDEAEMGELNSPHSLGTYLLMISMCF